MKPLLTGLILLLSLNFYAQNFDLSEYAIFLEEHQNMEYEDLVNLHPLTNIYYKGIETTVPVEQCEYYDTVLEKYNLTEDEIALLNQNHFMVSERLSFEDFGHAFQDVWVKDLPVFVSTDAILHAIHLSYDQILQDLERYYLLNNLDTILSRLYNTYPQFHDQYSDNEDLTKSLKDADLYITIAYSLLQKEVQTSHFVEQTKVQEIWDAIQAETFAELPLFTEYYRKIDFSQFKVRGHYVDDENTSEYFPSLEGYFKAMMWLGRIDFWLTAPLIYEPIPEEDVQRMCIDALLLNEIITMADVESLIEKNNSLIDALVGESDNLTIDELEGICTTLNIDDPADLLDPTTLSVFQDTLKKNNAYGQKILSSILAVDPCSSTPDTLPVSYKLMGQRFIIDSYVFSNVVYDRIVYEENKELRLMPDPLDILFALGNDNAAPLLEEEINLYKYSTQLSSLRYLINSYDESFWENSLYNTWLDGIKSLNTPEDLTSYPLFMKSAGWQQEKMNTQLSSWSQLRHDNLLYAKPSYTGWLICYYPHSYVEPIPDFYQKIEVFASKASTIFNNLGDIAFELYHVDNYFENLAEIMEKLGVIAQKEIDLEAFSQDEIDFLQSMLYEGGECSPEFTGWYPSLVYYSLNLPKPDYIIADVHTQPNDSTLFPIGKVLHVGTGKINLGIFMAPSPSNNLKKIPFIGPVMSYYEKKTTGFYRMTDEEWAEDINADNIPQRPDWVNIYLADKTGTRRDPGRELPAVNYVGIPEINNINSDVSNINIFPNPINETTELRFYLNTAGKTEIVVFNYLGQKVIPVLNNTLPVGHHRFSISSVDHAPGIYYLNIKTEKSSQTMKIIK